MTGNDRVDMCVMIESEVSSSMSREWSLFLELVVYEANLLIYVIGNVYRLLVLI